MSFVLLFNIIFRIVVILRIRTLISGIIPTQSFVEVLTSMTAIWYVVVVVGLIGFLFFDFRPGIRTRNVMRGHIRQESSWLVRW